MSFTKKILILGGTKFIGRNLVQYLRNVKGVELTLFNRGISNPKIFGETKTIIGDRNSYDDIKRIGQQTWDIVIDLSCYYPLYLDIMLPIIEYNTDKIIFLSSVLAYNIEDGSYNNKETLCLKECHKDYENDTSWNSYGYRKAACEKRLHDSKIPNKIILRPAITYGEYDLLDRFNYWIERVQCNRQIMLPDMGADIANYTYVKDLVKVVVECINSEVQNEAFNTTTHTPISLFNIVKSMANLMDKKIDLINIPSSFLIENSIVPRIDIPLWSNGNHFSFDNTKLKNYFKIELFSFDDSIRNTIQYYNLNKIKNSNNFLTIEKEQNLIRQYYDIQELGKP